MQKWCKSSAMVMEFTSIFALRYRFVFKEVLLQLYLKPSGAETELLWNNQVDSLTPGRCGSNFKSLIFRLIIQHSSLGTCCEIALRWMPENLTNKRSTLLQVMAWCRQAPSHYLNQCWPRKFSTTRFEYAALITFHRTWDKILAVDIGWYIYEITA